MSEDKKKEEGGFTTSDKRRFDDEGNPKADAGSENSGQSSKGQGTKFVPDEQQSKDAEQRYEQCETSTAGERKNVNSLPEIDFNTFIMSLSSSAFVHMGLIPDPIGGKKEVNLPAAKQTIDIISMLETKTANNLSEDEKELLSRILFDLRMKFVQLCNLPSSNGSAQ